MHSGAQGVRFDAGRLLALVGALVGEDCAEGFGDDGEVACHGPVFDVEEVEAY